MGACIPFLQHTLISRSQFSAILQETELDLVPRFITQRGSVGRIMALLLIFYWSVVALQCCSFLQYSKGNQLYISMYPVCFQFPFHLGHHRALGCLYYTVVYQVFISCIAVCVWQSQYDQGAFKWFRSLLRQQQLIGCCVPGSVLRSQQTISHLTRASPSLDNVEKLCNLSVLSECISAEPGQVRRQPGLGACVHCGSISLVKSVFSLTPCGLCFLK